MMLKKFTDLYQEKIKELLNKNQHMVINGQKLRELLYNKY